MRWNSNTTDENILEDFMSHFPYDYDNIKQRKFVFESLMFKRYLLAVRWQILKDVIEEDFEEIRCFVYKIVKKFSEI
ncbi:hypothetical protein SAMN05443270_3138 [Lacrimispora sphenoides]|uniref:hypothetical protein n=1 Tax=Lacrimispora sphenoides TaxID=29370 RepID=UPI0008BFF70A|nr:hypothetical protein [Lacrimispora sphenoides]SEU09910.1 hypothetical protein SAMN05443270_3138 [Lacrimispora sphenoides]